MCANRPGTKHRHHSPQERHRPDMRTPVDRHGIRHRDQDPNGGGRLCTRAAYAISLHKIQRQAIAGRIATMFCHIRNATHRTFGTSGPSLAKIQQYPNRDRNHAPCAAQILKPQPRRERAEHYREDRARVSPHDQKTTKSLTGQARRGASKTFGSYDLPPDQPSATSNTMPGVQEVPSHRTASDAARRGARGATQRAGRRRPLRGPPPAYGSPTSHDAGSDDATPNGSRFTRSSYASISSGSMQRAARRSSSAISA